MDTLFGEEESDRVSVVVRLLQRVPGWPADERADRRFAGQLLEQYPRVDLEGELAKFHEWALKHQQEMLKGRPRARFQNWVCIADRPYRGPRKPGGRGGSAVRPRRGDPRTAAGGAPAAPGAFPQSGVVAF